MNIINKYKSVIAVILAVLLLICIKIFYPGGFKNDSSRWAHPSISQSNLVAPGDLSKMPGKKLIVDLDSKVSGLTGDIVEEIHILPDSVLNRKNLDRIKEHSGPVLLFSSDPALSSRIWMLIRQLGYENIYILSDNLDNELFKNELRPDTIARPEP